MSVFTHFKENVSHIHLPEKFTYPFYYEAHPIAITAAHQLQDYLDNQTTMGHPFGSPSPHQGTNDEIPIGKMFGVLVVKNRNGELGFVSAFSGKIGDSNHHHGFVPPVYDMLVKGDYFDVEGEVIKKINKQIDELQKDGTLAQKSKQIESVIETLKLEIQSNRKQFLANKSRRKAAREIAKKALNDEHYVLLHNEHKKESLKQTFEHRSFVKESQKKLEALQQELVQLKAPIKQLKTERKKRSAQLQKKLFNSYHFLNAQLEKKSLLEIFENTVLKTPPAGAGECAAPKLLQYAFKNQLQPIAMSEFWYGSPPPKEIRKHLSFYPACKGKCEPILGHMLKRTELDKNPLLDYKGKDKDIEILHEEDDFLIINKPPELLSVPGKEIFDSVAERIKARYPKAEGPIIVHRLDMSTSGLMIIPLNNRSYEYIQRQFIKRKVQKTYVALLDGSLAEKTGKISLPLSLDFLDRPKQMVDHKNGKKAITRYEVIEEVKGNTKIYFYPETGRTHQLRVHAAHHEGLNCPIVGDDLYGKRGLRLHLHARSISFNSPKTKVTVHFECPERF